MKASIILLFLVLNFINAYAQHYKQDGTPDMRYKENKEMYGSYSQSYQNQSYNNSYSAPNYNTYQNSYQAPSYNTNQPTYNINSYQERNYNSGGQIYMQDGYMRSNGTYVEPHFKTKPDDQTWNNYNNLYK